jgi:hypothetical protein
LAKYDVLTPCASPNQSGTEDHRTQAATFSLWARQQTIDQHTKCSLEHLSRSRF